jgi:hypothetical protein
VEISFMLVAKVGTIYASFAGARAAVVWDSLDAGSGGQSVAERAAARAFLPFSSAGFSNSPSSKDARFTEYLADYSSRMKTLGVTPAASSYLDAKTAYMSRALSVGFTRKPHGTNPWDEDLSVEVTYDFPFAVPGVGILFGTRRADGYVYPISSRTTLPNEVPHNPERRLGIEYGQ